MCGYEELLAEVRGLVALAAEDGALVLPGELELQALWFAGQMGRDFVTVDGRSVRVVQFGYWNRGVGPDFLHAAVEVDGELCAGAIELDHSAAEWVSHGHGESADFDNVVLHVVFVESCKQRFTRTSKDRDVPQVVVPQTVLSEALQMTVKAQAAAHLGRCYQPLAGMHEGNVNALMMAAVRRRVRLKAERRARTVEVIGEEEWLWQSVAEMLGYRPNKLAMVLLAQRFPVAMLREMPEVCEAVLFGAAGFLTAQSHDTAVEESRGYLRDLWEAWWQVRDRYEPDVCRKIPWKLSGVRPVNHPQRRVACLAEIARNWSAFVEVCQSTERLEAFFRDLKHPYWSHHYTVQSKRSERAMALVGRERLLDFQINHVLLARLMNGCRATWEYYLKVPAPTLSEKVERASVRLFGTEDRRKIYLKKAWQHQALLQIYQDFCLEDVSDCKDCPFPEQLSQWRG